MAVADTRPLPGSRPRTERRDPGLLRKIADRWADYLYVLPAILVMLVVIGYPIVYTVILSFHDTPARSSEWIFVGGDNFPRILSNPMFWKITGNTMVWTFGSTIFAFVLGVVAALALHKAFPGRGIVRAILLIPWVISAVAAAYVWRWLLHSDYGLLSGTLMQWGIIDRPLVLLDSTTWVMPTMVMVNVWKEFPFVMIMFTAGLQTVPEQQLRAARVDGANTWNQFVHVTLPHVRGVVVITTLLLFVVNLNSFTLVFLMTGGGPANASQLWITEIYNLAFRSLQYGLASAFSVILFVIMIVIGFFYVRALNYGSDNRRAGG